MHNTKKKVHLRSSLFTQRTKYSFLKRSSINKWKSCQLPVMTLYDYWGPRRFKHVQYHHQHVYCQSHCLSSKYMHVLFINLHACMIIWKVFLLLWPREFVHYAKIDWVLSRELTVRLWNIYTCNHCLTNTLVVTSHEINTFSMSVSFAFSWWRSPGLSYTRAAQNHACDATQNKRWFHVTSLALNREYV